MVDVNDDPRNARLEKLRFSADEATKKSERENRRSFEIRANFYDKLSALSAGSIAIAASVGIALLAKSEAHVGYTHSNLSWLVAIAFFLWISLISAIGHNYLFAKIARLEAEEARGRSGYLGLISASATAHRFGSQGSADIVDKMLTDSVEERIDAAASRGGRIELSVNRLMFLGQVAVASFLLAYTVVFICVVRLWCLTR